MSKIVKLFLVIAIFSTALVANEKRYRLKMASSWGPTLSPLIDTSLEMARLAQELSNGQLQIRVDNANRHKAPFGVLDMVKGGQYDIGHSASYYWKGKDVAMLPFTSMPFGMNVLEQYAWFYEGGGLELMQKIHAKHNLYSFPGGNTGTQMGGWFKKEINTLDDLKGLKMRIPGFAGEVMSKLGVQVINIAPGEIYTALETNAVEAVDWVGPSMDITMGFHKVTPYYYTPWQEPNGELQFIINKKVFDTLPKHLQNILQISMKLAAYNMYIKNFDMNVQAWDKMKNEYPNIQIRTFPKPILDRLKEVNEELIEKMASENAEFNEVIQSQKEYLKKARTWSEISEYTYLKDNLVK